VAELHLPASRSRNPLSCNTCWQAWNANAIEGSKKGSFHAALPSRCTAPEEEGNVILAARGTRSKLTATA
jgi:hypothetical protein